MDRRDFTRIGLGLTVAGTPLAAAGSAQAAYEPKDKTHRVAIQVSSDDHKTQELALGNAHNYAAYYKAKGEPCRIEVVAFGPGYNMVRDDISMVKGNIENLKQELGAAITFSACQNTRAGIAASMGRRRSRCRRSRRRRARRAASCASPSCRSRAGPTSGRNNRISLKKT